MAKKLRKRQQNVLMQRRELENPLDALCRHVVSLQWLDAKCESDVDEADVSGFDPRACAVSAFVVCIRDVWFLITAGHVLNDLETRLASGRRRIIKSRLMDGFAVAPKYPAIPFSLGETPQWYIYADGRDYAVIPLRPGYVAQLRAGGVEALDEISWTELPHSLDHYFLIGFPTQASQINVKTNGRFGTVSVQVRTPLLPLNPTDNPPASLKRKNERFYASVPIATGKLDGNTMTLTDIDGMSGGPIFGAKRIGRSRRLRYWIIAIQSGWDLKARVLAACPIHPLVNAISKYLDDHPV